MRSRSPWRRAAPRVRMAHAQPAINSPSGRSQTSLARISLAQSAKVSDSGRRARRAPVHLDTELCVPETVADILAAHRAGRTTPEEIVARSYARIRAHADPAIFIALREEAQAQAEAREIGRAAG